MGKRILVLDDDRHIVHILKRRLEALGYGVVTGRNGEQGVELAQTHRPDLIVSDYQMPVCDGYEMAVRLAEDEQLAEVPVLMLTARGHKLSPSQLVATNIRCVMDKPFSCRELLATVEEMLGAGSDTEPISSDHV